MPSAPTQVYATGFVKGVTAGRSGLISNTSIYSMLDYDQASSAFPDDLSLGRPEAYLCRLEISVWYGSPSPSARLIASRSLLDRRMFSRRSLRIVALAQRE
jgi:hypothetical protein